MEKEPFQVAQLIRDKWALQTLARELVIDFGTKKHRILHCCRTLAQGWEYSDAVRIVKSDGIFSYKGLQTCGSWSACPICSAKIANYRRKEITRAVESWGGGVLFLTLTIPHYADQSLQEVREKFMVARRRLRAQKILRRSPDLVPWRLLADRYGVVGSITGFETTYGENGWHYHCHELVFCSRKLSKIEIESFETFLKFAWEKACKGAKIELGSRFAFFVRSVQLKKADGGCVNYVTKGWGPVEEVSLSHSKQGRSGGYTPFGLLRLIIDNPGDETIYNKYGKLFVESVETFKGKNQLLFSKGFKKLLKIEEISDEEVVEIVEKEVEDVGVLDYYTWKTICILGLRGYLLARLTIGDKLEKILLSIENIKQGCNYEDDRRACKRNGT